MVGGNSKKDSDNAKEELRASFKSGDDLEKMAILLEVIKEYEGIPTILGIAKKVGVSSNAIYSKRGNEPPKGLLARNPEFIPVFIEACNSKGANYKPEDFGIGEKADTLANRFFNANDKEKLEILLEAIRKFDEIPTTKGIAKKIGISDGSIYAKRCNRPPGGLLARNPEFQEPFNQAIINRIQTMPKELLLKDISKSNIPEEHRQAIDNKLLEIILDEIKNSEGIPTTNGIAKNIGVTYTTIYAKGGNKPVGLLARNPEFQEPFNQAIINRIQTMPKELLLKDISNSKSTIPEEHKQAIDNKLLEIILDEIKNSEGIPTKNGIAKKIGVSNGAIYAKNGNKLMGLLARNPEFIPVFIEACNAKGADYKPEDFGLLSGENKLEIKEPKDMFALGLLESDNINEDRLGLDLTNFSKEEIEIIGNILTAAKVYVKTEGNRTINAFSQWLIETYPNNKDYGTIEKSAKQLFETGSWHTMNGWLGDGKWGKFNELGEQIEVMFDEQIKQNIKDAAKIYVETDGNRSINAFSQWLVETYPNKEDYETNNKSAKQLFWTDNRETMNTWLVKTGKFSELGEQIEKDIFGIEKVEIDITDEQIKQNIRVAAKVYVETDGNRSITAFSQWLIGTYPNNKEYRTIEKSAGQLFGTDKWGTMTAWLVNGKDGKFNELGKQIEVIFDEQIKQNITMAAKVYAKTKGNRSINAFSQWLVETYPNKEDYETNNKSAKQLFGADKWNTIRNWLGNGKDGKFSELGNQIEKEIFGLSLEDNGQDTEKDPLTPDQHIGLNHTEDKPEYSQIEQTRRMQMVYARFALAVAKKYPNLFEDKYVLELARLENTLLDVLTSQNIEPTDLDSLRANKALKTKEGTYETDYNSKSFSTVFSVCSMHNNSVGKHTGLVLNEMNRIMMPGGKLVIAFPLSHTAVQNFDKVLREYGFELKSSQKVCPSVAFQKKLAELNGRKVQSKFWFEGFIHIIEKIEDVQNLNDFRGFYPAKNITDEREFNEGSITTIPQEIFDNFAKEDLVLDDLSFETSDDISMTGPVKLIFNDEFANSLGISMEHIETEVLSTEPHISSHTGERTTEAWENARKKVSKLKRKIDQNKLDPRLAVYDMYSLVMHRIGLDSKSGERKGERNLLYVDERREYINFLNGLRENIGEGIEELPPKPESMPGDGYTKGWATYLSETGVHEMLENYESKGGKDFSFRKLLNLTIALMENANNRTNVIVPTNFGDAKKRRDNKSTTKNGTIKGYKYSV